MDVLLHDPLLRDPLAARYFFETLVCIIDYLTHPMFVGDGEARY